MLQVVILQGHGFIEWGLPRILKKFWLTSRYMDLVMKTGKNLKREKNMKHFWLKENYIKFVL